MKLIYLIFTISTATAIKFSDVRSYLRKKAKKFYQDKKINPPAKKFLESSENNDVQFARSFSIKDSINNTENINNQAILAIFDMIDPVSENFFENNNSPWLRSGGSTRRGGMKLEMMSMLKEFIRYEYRKNPSAFPPPTLQT